MPNLRDSLKHEGGFINEQSRIINQHGRKKRIEQKDVEKAQTL